MRLKIEKEEIQKALQNIQGIVERKTTMPILSHFLLSADETVSIMATDLDIAIKGGLKAEVLEKGSLCIPARKLFEIVKELEEDILLESTENNWLQVSSGKSIFKLMGLPEEEYPSLPEVSHVDKVTMNADILKRMIEKTIYAVGDSDPRYTMNGLLLHFIPKRSVIELRLVGTDGHRLSLITKEIEGKVSSEKKLILPKKAVVEVGRLLEEKVVSVTAGLNKNHIFFTTDDIQLSSRLIEGTYPNYEQVIPQSNEKKVTLPKIEFLKALRRVSIMSREGTNAIRLDIEPKRLTLSSINPDLGEAREEMGIHYRGEPISVGFNARYLMDALRFMDGDSIRVELRDPLSPVLLCEMEEKGYNCVIMPMRI